jgi:hypothetical protein
MLCWRWTFEGTIADGVSAFLLPTPQQHGCSLDMRSQGLAKPNVVMCFKLAPGEKSGHVANLGLQDVFLILSTDVTACSPTDDIGLGC